MEEFLPTDNLVLLCIALIGPEIDDVIITLPFSFIGYTELLLKALSIRFCVGTALTLRFNSGFFENILFILPSINIGASSACALILFKISESFLICALPLLIFIFKGL